MKKKEFSDEFDDNWDPNEWQGRSPDKIHRDAKVTGIILVVSVVLILVMASLYIISKLFN